MTALSMGSIPAPSHSLACVLKIVIRGLMLSLSRHKADNNSPRGTIATAQMLYIRFHLFFPYKDFNYMVCSVSLFVYLPLSSRILRVFKPFMTQAE